MYFGRTGPNAAMPGTLRYRAEAITAYAAGRMAMISGTVAKEMNAYRVAGKTGFVHAFDLMKEDSLKALDIASGPRKAFGILIGDKKRFLQASESNADLINSYEYLDHTLSRAVDQPATTSIIVLVPVPSRIP